MLPPPQAVTAFLWHECVSGALPKAFAATLSRVVVAFVLAMAGGSVVGYLTGRSRRINAWLDPWVVITLNLPVLVVIVLAYIWVGLNDAAAVLAVVVAKAPTVVVTVREGARALDPGLAEMAAAFHLPRWRRLRFVVLPQLLPYLAGAARSGLSITWKIVLVVELLGRPNGVGYALNLYFQNFNVTGILAYGLAFAGMMLLVEATVLQPLEGRVNAWRTDGRPASARHAGAVDV
jgi:NitT/TauT family transport system permease protein